MMNNKVSSLFKEENNGLKNDLQLMSQFKLIAQKIMDDIVDLENKVEHIKFSNTARELSFSPRIFLQSITIRERNLLYQCGKGLKIEDAVLLAYNRRNLKTDKLKLKLTEKACVEVDCYNQLATTCYQYIIDNMELLSIEKSLSGF